jgi:hypothetical protein
VGAVLDSLFRPDLAQADEITLERHRARSSAQTTESVRTGGSAPATYTHPPSSSSA